MEPSVASSILFYDKAAICSGGEEGKFAYTAAQQAKISRCHFPPAEFLSVMQYLKTQEPCQKKKVVNHIFKYFDAGCTLLLHQCPC